MIKEEKTIQISNSGEVQGFKVDSYQYEIPAGIHMVTEVVYYVIKTADGDRFLINKDFAKKKFGGDFTILVNGKELKTDSE